MFSSILQRGRRGWSLMTGPAMVAMGHVFFIGLLATAAVIFAPQAHAQAPVVSVMKTVEQVYEHDPVPEFRVQSDTTIPRDTSLNVTVKVTVEGITVTNPATLPNGGEITVNIAGGSNSAAIAFPFTFVDDADIEASGSRIIVEVVRPPMPLEGMRPYETNPATDGFAAGTVACSGPDAPSSGRAVCINFLDNEPIVSATTAEAREGNPLVFTVRFDRAASPARAIRINYATSNAGTATAATMGDDYEHVTGVLTFVSPETEQQVRVPTFEDLVEEDDEQLFLILDSETFDHTIAGGSASVGGTITNLPNAALSAIDAEAVEGTTLFMPVRLSRPSAVTISVRYAVTPDGDNPATPGVDYFEPTVANVGEGATPGEIIFNPGQTERFVRIQTMRDEDDIDDTLTLTISMPMNATLGRTTATGTIREGLSAAQQTILNQAAAARAAGVINHQVAAMLVDRVGATLGGSAGAQGFSLRGLSPRRFVAQSLERDGAWHQSNTPDRLRLGPEEVAFGAALNGDMAMLGLGNLAVWGRGYANRVDYESDTNDPRNALSMDSAIEGVLLGMDAHNDDLLLGLALNKTRAESDFRLGPVAGMHKTDLTGIYPYIGHNYDDTWRLWGGLGINQGEMEIIEGRNTTFDVDMRSFVVGGNGVLRERRGPGSSPGSSTRGVSVRMQAVGDLSFAQVSGEPAEATGPAEDFDSDSTTARLGVRFAYNHAFSADNAWALVALGDTTWGARASAMLRYDDGDDLSGIGVELGGGTGLVYSDLRFNFDARALAGHEAELKEWGASLSLAWHPPVGQGLSFAFKPQWGDIASDAGQLWRHGIGSVADSRSSRGYDLEVKYGIELAREQSQVVLFARDGVATATRRMSLGADYRLGGGLSAGYESVIAADDPTDHRGYLRYRWAL